MAMLERVGANVHRMQGLSELCGSLWDGKVTAAFDGGQMTRLHCGLDHLVPVAQWLSRDLGFAFATLIVEQSAGVSWTLVYVFYHDAEPSWAYVEVKPDTGVTTVPSISGLVHGPSADWHEREVGGFVRTDVRRSPAPRRVHPARGLARGCEPDATRFRCAAAIRAPRARSAMGAANHRHGSRRVRHAGRSRVLGFRRIRPLPAGDGRRGRYPHYPAVLLQIPRCREDCRRTESRSGLAACRAILRHLRLCSWLGILSRQSSRSAASKCHRGHRHCELCSPSWSACAITRRRSPGSAIPRRLRSRPVRLR